MNREERNQAIEEISAEIAASPHFYLADISEITVETANKLRRKCHQEGVKLKVVKNTLLKKALQKSGVTYEELFSALSGPTSIMFSEKANAPARIIRDFRKSSEKPILKAAYVEESVYLGDEQLTILASLKSKNELIAEVIALLDSPIKNVLSALQSGGHTISGLVKTLGQRKDAPPAA